MTEFFFVFTVFLLIVLMLTIGYDINTYQTTKSIRNHRLTIAEDENKKKQINLAYRDELRNLKADIIYMSLFSIVLIFIIFASCVSIKRTAMEQLMKGEYKVEKTLKYKVVDNDTTAVDTVYNFYKAK